jgi:hypothetical protein
VRNSGSIGGSPGVIGSAGDSLADLVAGYAAVAEAAGALADALDAAGMM